MAGLDLRTSMDKCASMRFTAPSPGVSAGDMIAVEDLVGVVVDDADTGDDAVLIYQAEKILLPKSTTSGQNTFTAGDKIYFDSTDSNVNSSSSGNTLCGRALEDAVGSDTTVLAHLMGNVVG